MTIDINKTQAENAIINNCTRQTIARYCKKHNIILKEGRGMSPSLIKLNPFDISTRNGSYWFGYFLGDGIHSKKSIGICSKDYDIVNDFHSYCGNNNKIYGRPYMVQGKKYHIYSSLFTDHSVTAYLETLGVSFVNKTFGTNLKIQFNWDIIRGLFDADGSFTKNEFKFTTSNVSIKQQLIDFFTTNGFKIRTSKKGKAWDIVIKREYYESRDSQYSKLYSLLYFKSEYFLLRKRLQFAAVVGDNYMKTGLIAGTSLESN